MDPEFRESLVMRGVKRESIDLLEKEDILREKEIFHLRMDDLKLFLDRGIKIGQYSIITRLWEEKMKGTFIYKSQLDIHMKYCILYIVLTRDTSGLGSDTSCTSGTSGDGTCM